MSKLEILLEEAEDTPEPILGEVIDFLRFLKATRLKKGQPEQLDLSKTAFGADLSSPEEDEAWRNLQDLAEPMP